MNPQLTIPVETIRHDGDHYTEAVAQYNKSDKPKGHKVFLCYGTQIKRYFVSKFFSKEFIISTQPTVKIIQ